MRVSVIIPTYNRSDLLKETLASVMVQTRKPDEVVVVDNGSEAVAIPKTLVEKVRVIRITPNAGVAHARNIGAKESHGDILAFLDDDDLWEPGYLEHAEHSIKSGADCSISRLDSLEKGVVKAYKNADIALTLENLFMFNPGVTGSNIVIKKSVFEKLGGFDPELPTGEDKSLVIEALWAGVDVRTLTDNHAVHRIHDGDRLSDPLHLAQGISAFTKKYKKSMSRKAYRFNKRKYFRALVDGRNLFAYPALIWYALLYRISR